MRLKVFIVAFVAIVFTLPLFAQQAPQPKAVTKTPAHRVVATYFHGDVRCATCRKIETFSREAVEDGFADQIEAGTVVFRAINTDRPENKHYLNDYKLMTKSLIITDERNGKVVAWVNLPKIWTLVGEPDEFRKYVRDSIQTYVAKK